MFRLGVVVAGLIGLTGLSAAENPPTTTTTPPSDLTLLQGNWKPLSIEFEGKPQATAAELQKLTAVFDQSEYHLYFVDKAQTPPKVLKLAVMNVSLDSSTSPKSFTFVFATGELKGQKRHGIYELAGNQLKICYGPSDKPRPTTFAAPANSGHFLEVWAKQPTK